MTKARSDLWAYDSRVADKIIVADDEEDIRLLCRVNLEADGFEVHEASDADELMLVAHRIGPIAAIVLDVTMPGRDGWQCLGELKGSPELRHIPVVMLSAHVHEGARDEALSRGASEYVSKPFSPQRLVDVVRELIDRPR